MVMKELEEVLKSFLGKIVQKDYSNQLEKIIETKDFECGISLKLENVTYKGM